MFLVNSRTKKNISAKVLYSLLNNKGYLIFFHNNKKFTEFRYKILFGNSIKSYVVKNSLFSQLLFDTNVESFVNLVCGPTGIILLSTELEFLRFFKFYFNLYSLGELENIIFLAVYCSSTRSFYSLEYLFNTVSQLAEFVSISSLINAKILNIFSCLIQPFVMFIYLLNQMAIHSILTLNMIAFLKFEKSVMIDKDANL